MIRKIIITAAAIGVSFGTVFIANAQLFPFTGSTTTQVATSSTSTLPSSTPDTSTNTSTVVTPSTTISTPTITTPSATTPGFTTSTGSVTAPLNPITTPSTPTPTATAPSTNVGGTGTIASGLIQFNGLTVTSVSGATLPATILAAATEGSSSVMTATCMFFATPTTSVGVPIACPSTSNSIMVQVDPNTQLLFSNRQTATIANFTPGDMINAFGLLTNGTLQGQIVRDTSKPVGAVSSGSVLGANTNTASGTVNNAAIEAVLMQMQTLVAQISAIINSNTIATSTNTNTNSNTNLNSGLNTVPATNGTNANNSLNATTPAAPAAPVTPPTGSTNSGGINY